MSEHKWCELILEDSTLYRSNIEKLKNYIKKDNISVDVILLKKEEFLEKLAEAKKDYSAIRVDYRLANQLFKSFTTTSAEVYMLQACDSLVKQGEDWISKANFKNGIENTLTSRNKNLDLDKKVLVSGDGYIALSAISVLSKMGIRNICISNTHLKKSEDLKKSILKFQHSSEVEIIEADQLSLLKDEFNVFINTLRSSSDNSEFIKDICYFNFLSASGYVWDFRNLSTESEFCKQSKQLGYESIGLEEALVCVDRNWLKLVFGVDLAPQAYKQSLQSN